jgi:hypothetical protein
MGVCKKKKHRKKMANHAGIRKLEFLQIKNYGQEANFYHELFGHMKIIRCKGLGLPS